jgi:hypothetical protein
MAVLKYYNTTTSAWEYIAASTTANFTSWKKTMAGGETSVSGTDDNSVTLSYTAGLEQVFINGVLQVRGSDYTATDGTSVTGLTALVASDIVTVVCYAPFNVANTIAPTLVDAKGDLLVGTGADAVGRLAVGTNNQLLSAASGETTGLKWANPGLTLIKTQSFSAVASSSVNDIFSSTYKNYFYMLSATLTTGTASLTFRLRVNSTDTSTNYQSDRLLQQSTTVSGVSDTTGTDDMYIGEITTFEPCTFSGYLFNPFETKRTIHQGRNVLLDGNGNLIQFVMAGAHTASTSFTGLTLIPDASTITGTISIFGVNE